MTYEWDAAKADANRRKHGVMFEEAVEALADPRRVVRFDADHSDYEDRWIAIGTSGKLRLLSVCHTETDEQGRATITRIISARKASKAEIQDYVEAQR